MFEEYMPTIDLKPYHDAYLTAAEKYCHSVIEQDVAWDDLRYHPSLNTLAVWLRRRSEARSYHTIMVAAYGGWYSASVCCC